MTDTVRDQILAIRDTGLTNMFDIPMVQRLAYERGFYELVCYLEEHRKEYAHFILTGEADGGALNGCAPSTLCASSIRPSTAPCSRMA